MNTALLIGCISACTFSTSHHFAAAVDTRTKPWTATASASVSVSFFGESGCPDCQAFIAGPLNETLVAPGVAAVMDFVFHPFGNAYFMTAKCGGTVHQYSMQVRHCFDKTCGFQATAPPSDCFTGHLQCQHGPSECIMNLYYACAIEVASNDFMKYMPFITCVSARWNSKNSLEQWQQLVATCADFTTIDAAALQQCYGSGWESNLKLAAAEANATPDHEGVPYVVVNGQVLENTDQLLKAVCDAVQGEKPMGCSQVMKSAASSRVVLATGLLSLVLPAFTIS